MSNAVKKEFTADASVTIPGGIKQIRLIVEKKYIQVFGNCKANGVGSGGYVSNLWLDQYGQAWGAGLNTSGFLGNGNTTAQSVPVAVIGGALPLVFLTGDNNNVTGSYFGINSAGKGVAWGANASGQLGVGDVTARSSQVAILGNLTFSQIVTTGGSSVWGLTPAGQIFGWGFSPSVSGDTIPHSSPVAAVGVAGLVFKKIFGSYGTGNTYFLTTANKLYGAGVNTLFALGVGDGVGRSSPVAVGPSINFADVACAGLFTVATDTSGAAWGWGQNDKGQLGNGGTATQSTPVAVIGGIVFQQVFSHVSKSSYGIDVNGVAYAWGDNSQGQLCVGDLVARSSPVAVLGLSGVKIKSITCGQDGLNFSNSVYFLATDGTLYAGGGNPTGQLGVGDVVGRSSAVAVLGGFKFINIWNFPAMMGLCDDGVVRAWGYNGNGQLGLGDANPRSSPVAVTGAMAMPPFSYRDEKVLSVIPGTTYSLKMNFGMVTFGTDVISRMAYADKVTLIYEQ